MGSSESLHADQKSCAVIHSKSNKKRKAFKKLNRIIGDINIPSDKKIKQVKRFVWFRNLTRSSFLDCDMVDYPPVIAIRSTFQRDILDTLCSLGFKFPDPDVRSTRYILPSLCKNDKFNAVKCLVEEYGVDVNETDRSNVSLFGALEKGHLEIVKFLVEKGVWLNVRNATHKSILHIAERNISSKFYEFLISHGADVNATDDSGNTPLHYAANEYCDGLVYTLLQVGADMNQRNVHGESAFSYAFVQYKKFLKYPHNPNYTHICTALTNIIMSMLDAGFMPDGKDFALTSESEDVNVEVRNRIESIRSNPRSLQELCIFNIRHVLGTNVQTSVECLPLPLKYKNFLKLNYVQIQSIMYNQ